MFAYIARQPIFDTEQNVIAYELLFRDSEKNCFPDISADEATSKILTSSHLSLGIEEICSNKTAFINFHKDTLLYRFPTSLDANAVVIEILETIEVTKELVSACRHIRNLGYKLALDDYDFDPKWDVFLPFVDIVKVDIQECPLATTEQHIHKLKEHKVKLVAEKVETLNEFHTYRELGFDYFQGYYLARPEVVKHKQLGASKLSLLELVSVSSSHNFDYDKVNEVLQRDVGLSFMLLRFINNPFFNKRNRINSLRHALTYMGEVEVKKFIALLALANLSDGKPHELMHMSLVRAKFCELLSIKLNQHENPPTGFLTGLFSLLDSILEQTMPSLVEKLPVVDDVKQALRGEPNVLHECVVVSRAFESGNWPAIEKFSIKYKVDKNVIHSFYNEAIKWGHAMQMSALNQ
ncbi:EAL and HDOD domain-containing protein [Alteromonas oceanisediminis]|uniref:EAL and HDOD domain-containing protein n=1 Tax=Alteromonas oceanisediminis TaxID=2836180 RepID=UPI001BDB1A87|nr:HDOD domain-containing protein [Alteromonas oceanisediminis]MBT0587696.1 HDOD domain-containing protein [Alteromonas oceanisediminis]